MPTRRDEQLEIPNSVVGLSRHVECKLADLRSVLQVQIDDLKLHVGELRDKAATRDELKVQLGSIERSIGVAATLMDKRLEGMNEFRDSLRDQASTFITRPEFNANREKIEEALRGLRDFRTEMKAKASLITVWVAVGLALCGLGISIASLISGAVK